MVDQRRIDDQRWVDARAAAKHLGIQVRSLYAYVSRGQVRSVPGEQGRPRLYALGDLERLRVRRDARAGHGGRAEARGERRGEQRDQPATARDERIGSAIVALGICERRDLDEQRHHVERRRLGPDQPRELRVWHRAARPGHSARRQVAGPQQLRHVLERLPLRRELDGEAAAIGRAAWGDRRDRRIEHRLAPAQRTRRHRPVTRALGAGSVARIAARALGVDEVHAPVIDQVLVLLADHELNASSFTARVTASTDANPYACVAAALATLSGPKHGSASLEVAQFADEVGSPEAAKAAVRALRKQGQVPPGFGHPLYATGDPRTPPLLDAAARIGHARRTRTLLAVVAATTDAFPSVDVGLAALVAALGVPASAGPGLFAVARSAGWLAHALEQRAAGHLLRPRARYVGVPVRDAIAIESADR